MRSHGPLTCAVEIFPSEVDAGEEASVTVRASCPHGCDLSGRRVSIRDQHDNEVASTELIRFNDDAYITSILALRTPLKVGKHHYGLVIPASETEDVFHEVTSTSFSFVTKAHAASVNAWGLPSAIAVGERFRLNVGVKCSHSM